MISNLAVRKRWWSIALVGALSGALGFVSFGSCRADVTGPAASESNITQIVTLLMRAQHLAQRPLDDEISRRGFKLFLEALDPMKSYFYQSDVDEFMKFETKLDDMLRQSDTRFAYVVFKKFLQRVDERVALVDELLRGKFDFTINEELISDPKELHYPRDEAEARERWRKRVKYDLLVLKANQDSDQKAADAQKATDGAKKKEPKDPREQVERRYKNFARRMHQFDNDELLETYLTAITTSYDPHTTYMSKESLENFRIQLRLELEGIGAQLLDQDGRCVVAKIIPGGAADKAGQLKEEDEIVSVGQGEDGELVDVVGQKLTDVVRLIRGEAGSVVRLGVMPAASNELVTYKITRAKIELNDEAAQGQVFEVGTKPNGQPYKVGVIDLHSFYMDMQGAEDNQLGYRSTTRDVRKILDNFNSQGVDGVVLDLRRNGGGSLIEAINLTGLFIDQGPVVQVKNSNSPAEQLRDTDAGMAWRGPLVVLISKFSASASEILAGAIQDYQRGLVIGDRSTHGKGTVQSLLDLGRQLIGGPHPPELGALKITMQQFYRPNGDSTQLRGVLSDITLPSVTTYMDVSESDLDYPIDFARVEAADYTKANMVDQSVVDTLRAHSKERVDVSSDFAKLFKRIELYCKQKARKRVTLNEKKFLAERAEVNAQIEERKEMEKQSDMDGSIERDYYLDEVLSIMRDYVQALHGREVAKVSY